MTNYTICPFCKFRTNVNRRSCHICGHLRAENAANPYETAGSEADLLVNAGSPYKELWLDLQEAAARKLKQLFERLQEIRIAVSKR